jgi:hypothetical protein
MSVYFHQTEPVTSVTETPVSTSFSGVPSKKVKITINKAGSDLQPTVKETAIKACIEGENIL